METVNFLASLWGFSLIIICFSFLAKPKHLKHIIAATGHETTMLFWGILSVVLGVASLLSYNTWSQSWQVIITIIGWLIIIKGILYLFMPEMVMMWLEKLKARYMHLASLDLVGGVILGCILVYFGLTV